jgi:Domain of unknown function (DUF4260)
MLTQPPVLLRIEEAALLILPIVAYQHLHYSWPLFAILFLTPDLFMLGYLANVRLGAATYNLVHTLTLPALDLASNRLHQALASPLSDRAHLDRPHCDRPPPRLRTQISDVLQRHSPPAHPLKIKFKIVSHFSCLKTHHPKHHSHHALHHVLTTKTPRFGDVFSKNSQ